MKGYNRKGKHAEKGKGAFSGLKMKGLGGWKNAGKRRGAELL